jgi:hypothetical protein
MSSYKEFNSPERAQYASEVVKPLAASGGYPKNIGFSAHNISNLIKKCYMRNCWCGYFLVCRGINKGNQVQGTLRWLAPVL